MCQHRAVEVGGAVSESAWGVREGTCRKKSETGLAVYLAETDGNNVHSGQP